MIKILYHTYLEDINLPPFEKTSLWEKHELYQSFGLFENFQKILKKSNIFITYFY